jgi:hypothetical protein
MENCNGGQLSPRETNRSQLREREEGWAGGTTKQRPRTIARPSRCDRQGRNDAQPTEKLDSSNETRNRRAADGRHQNVLEGTTSCDWCISTTTYNRQGMGDNTQPTNRR